MSGTKLETSQQVEQDREQREKTSQTEHFTRQLGVKSPNSTPRARTRRQIEQDRMRLARITQIAPQDAIREEVETYCRDLSRRELGNALGDPEDVVHELSKRLREEYADDEEACALANFLEKEVSGQLNEELDEGVPQPSSEIIDAEVRTASSELIRTWVGLLNVAWRFRADGVEEMELNRPTLYPNLIDFTPNMFGRWNNRKQRAISSLCNAVALSSGAIGRLTVLFSERLLAQLTQGSIELPDGLEIASAGNRIVLRDRD